MSPKSNTVRLTPSERFARGLTYSTVGPVDITRGALGLGVKAAQSSASWLGDWYRSGKLRRDLAVAQESIVNELAAAQEVVSNLPQALQEARRTPRRRPRPVLLIAAGAAVLAVGAVTFTIIRRSTQPEPSPLAPSVEVTPKP
jgi:hypothetical protein